MIARLVIDGVDVEILKEIPLSVNFSIADIKELDKRGGSGTKTIVLAGTQSVNKLFENIFYTNIELQTFNPGVSLEAIYYLNEKEQIKGDLQLLKIVLKPNGSIEYQCNLIGREGSIFVEMGESLLTDLDYSDLDHTFDKTEQKNSWATSYRKSGVATAFAYGEGYTYPFIKYGYTASDTIYDVNHFKPALPAREYLLRMFTALGYTWTSAFLDSAFFKRLYVPCNRDKIELSNAAISNSQYFVGKTTTASALLYGGNTSGNVVSFGNIAVYPQYDLETGAYFDASNQYDSVTNFYSTIGFSGVYNIVAFCQLDITINSAALVGGTWAATSSFYDSYIEINTGSGWVIVAAIANSNAGSTQAIGASKSYKSNCQSGNMYLASGTLVRVRSRIALTATLFDNTATPAANGTAYTADYVIPNGTQKNEHYLLRTDTATYDGNTLTMNNAIPQNIKQKDFFKWIMQCFNLYIEKDKTRETNLIIEPRDSFYSASVEDWTSKVDYAKDWEVSPMGELDARTYLLKYKDDKDYYNDLYQKQFTDNYGLKRSTISNDFIKAEKKIEVGFSPTPLVSNSSNNIICPHIYAKDGVNLKTVSHNLRLLYYGGLKNSGNAWSYTSTPSGTTSETQYPYIGHVDDPLAPTIDLNFDFPKQVYYTYPLAYYSTNNLYNAYYSKFINEITDIDSKIVVCSVRLTELDIMKFSFRKKVFIQHPLTGGTYYVVNKIIDYNPLVNETTKVELLKLKNYAAFVPSTIAIDLGDDTSSSTARIGYNPETNEYANTSTGNTLALGSSNRVLGLGCSATGAGNFIDETSFKSFLINCTECSVVGATNLTVIGASNRSFDSTHSNMTINETEAGNTKIKKESVTANFNIDPDVSVYFVDCTSGNILATYDLSTVIDKEITFKRIDASGNTFSIDDITGLATLDGAATPYNTALAQWATIKLTTDGTDLFTI